MKRRPDRRAVRVNWSRPDRGRIVSHALVPFLIVALLLSVIIPAIEMRRVMRLLREITEVIEPARALSWQLESGLVMEYSALQGYALSGDSVLLLRYRTMLDDETHRLATLEAMATLLGPDAVAHAVTVRHQVVEWQELNRQLFDGQMARAQFAAAARIQRSRRDSIINDIEQFPTQLASDAAGRLEQVMGHERQSLFINAVLVIVALASLAAVASLSRRERRLAAVLQEKATYETALREAAEALAAAFTMDEVAQQIARSALDATHAEGAFVESVETGRDGLGTLVVRGSAGISVPEAGTTRPYAGSFTEMAIKQEEPAIVAGLAVAYPLDPSVTAATGSKSKKSAIVLPLRHSAGPVGALILVGAGSAGLRAKDTGWEHTIAHLAALAYEKVRLLDEAREGRQELERVMKSRQRLMRGFSHDVKNPLGAADGYADLLGTGIYGELAPEQKETVQRIRGSIRRALDLIDDLHELARAETGNIVLRRELVDIGDLVQAIGDEYRGAAYASGLPLTVDVAEGLPLVETDSVRVRQIVGNLVSNAIKYTKTGAVGLHVRRYSAAAIRNIPETVEIDVTDSGPGIPLDRQEQIFEEFSRLNASHRPGAGLGLAISKRLAEALGGQIVVTSEIGCGSTFTFRIPVSAPVALVPVPPWQPPARAVPDGWPSSSTSASGA